MTIYSDALIFIHNCNKEQDIIIMKDKDEAVVLDKEGWSDLKWFIEEVTNWER